VYYIKIYVYGTGVAYHNFMTRDEYREEVIRRIPGYRDYKVVFPRLLREVAIHLFTKGIFLTPLAYETRRRLLQLEKLGYTDE
jgi:hypothetical protein